MNKLYSSDDWIEVKLKINEIIDWINNQTPSVLDSEESLSLRGKPRENTQCDCKMFIGGSGKLCPNCRKKSLEDKK